MISLLGYMGSGKSTIAKELATILELPFYDLDQEIERSVNLPISSIFQMYGEFYFRKLERKKLTEVFQFPKGIISLGGGTPCYYDNIKIINQHSQSFYLQSTPQELYSRLIQEKEKRPIISSIKNDELLSFITKNVKAREKYYKKADYLINNIIMAETVHEIITLYHENIH